MEATARKPIHRYGENIKPVTFASVHTCNIANVTIEVEACTRPDGGEYDRIEIAGVTLFMDREQTTQLRNALSRLIDGEVTE